MDGVYINLDKLLLALTQNDVFVERKQECFCSCHLDMYESNSPVIGINGGMKLAHFSLFFLLSVHGFLRKP